MVTPEEQQRYVRNFRNSFWYTLIRPIRGAMYIWAAIIFVLMVAAGIDYPIGLLDGTYPVNFTTIVVFSIFVYGILLWYFLFIYAAYRRWKRK